MTITFEQFQKSAVTSDDLNNDMPDLAGAWDDENGEPRLVAGRIYMNGSVYIEQMADGRWYLMIFNEDWIVAKDCLAELERRLYDFFIDEYPEQAQA